MFNAQRKAKMFLLAGLIACSFLASCSLQKRIGAAANETLLNIPDLKTAHIGISIYEPATNKYWFNYQADKFFTPASNTKIFSCYAGMKYLGDSLDGLAWQENGNDLVIQGTGDPTLLHPDFNYQPVISFLQHSNKTIYLSNANWQENALGNGWSWDDYNDDYMAERSVLPLYGNTIKFVQTQIGRDESQFDKPQPTIYTEPEINWKLSFNTDTSKRFSVKRNLHENIFSITASKEKNKFVYVPFLTNGTATAIELLKDTSRKEIKVLASTQNINPPYHFIKTQAADSLFKPMMHRSDNFFAEQTLLMVSNRVLGRMNDDSIIDTLLKTDFKDLPQRPNWADGSGLSRFNLFTPHDFIWILNKMQHEFSWQRISTILPAGNEGTLTNYYIKEGNSIHAKTGSLSGVIALSGYLSTNKNKILIFSVLVNNHQTSGRNVRKAVEKFIESIYDKY